MRIDVWTSPRTAPAALSDQARASRTTSPTVSASPSASRATQLLDLLGRQGAPGVGAELDLELLIAQRVFRPATVVRDTRLLALAALEPDAQHGGELVREDAVALLVGAQRTREARSSFTGSFTASSVKSSSETPSPPPPTSAVATVNGPLNWAA